MGGAAYTIFQGNTVKRFKVKFIQYVEGEETAEAIVEAETQEEALKKVEARDFTMYVVVKQNCERSIFDEYILGCDEIN